MDDYAAKPVRLETLSKTIARRRSPEGDRRWLEATRDDISPDLIAPAPPRLEARLVTTLDEAIIAQLEMIPGDHGGSLFSEVVALYQQQSPAQLRRIKALLEAGDRGAAAGLVHALRGSSANVGGARLPSLLTSLEGVLRGRGVGSIPELMGAVESEHRSLVTVLRARAGGG